MDKTKSKSRNIQSLECIGAFGLAKSMDNTKLLYLISLRYKESVCCYFLFLNTV